MRKFIQEFKAFAVRGNVIDLAVAVIIGNAINSIVSSLVKDIFMPIIGLFVGRIDVSSLELDIPSRVTKGSPLIIGYGSFLQAVLNFLTISFCIFLMLKILRKLKDFSFLKPKSDDTKEDATKEPKTEDLLIEIRDLLKEQAEKSTQSDLKDNLDNEH